QLNVAPSRYLLSSSRNARAPSVKVTLLSKPQLKSPEAGGANFNPRLLSPRPHMFCPAIDKRLYEVPNCNSKGPPTPNRNTLSAVYSEAPPASPQSGRPCSKVMSPACSTAGVKPSPGRS